MEPRKKDFRLGQVHGLISPKEKDSEAAMQRYLFIVAQRITIVRKRDNRSNPVIRFFAYEVPLEKAPRSESIDLLGYDNAHNLYIFELKHGKITEKLSGVNEQIEGYACKLNKIKKFIEREFNEIFFFPIEFKEIRKIRAEV